MDEEIKDIINKIKQDITILDKRTLELRDHQLYLNMILEKNKGDNIGYG